jgi:hypothetical protein
MQNEELNKSEGHTSASMQQIASDTETTTSSDAYKKTKKVKGQGRPNLQSPIPGSHGSSDPGIHLNIDHAFEISTEYQLVKEDVFSTAHVIFKIKADIKLNGQVVGTFKSSRSHQLSAELFGKLTSGDENFKLGLTIE